MTTPVDWTDRSLAEASKLNPQVRARVFQAVNRFAETGHGVVKALKAAGGALRLRVGNYRIVFEYNNSRSGERIMRVLRVLPRDRAYRNYDD